MKDDPRRESLVRLRPKTAEDVAEWVRLQRGLSGHGGQSTGSTMSTRSTYPEIAANGALVLIAVATALLSRQIEAQAAALSGRAGLRRSSIGHVRAGKEMLFQTDEIFSDGVNVAFGELSEVGLDFGHAA